MANPYFVSPGNDYSQGLTGLSSVLRDIGEQKRLREAEEAARIKEEQTLLDINTAIDSGDPDQIHKVAIKYPRIAESIYRGFDIKRDDRKDQLKGDILGMITASPD